MALKFRNIFHPEAALIKQDDDAIIKRFSKLFPKLVDKMAAAKLSESAIESKITYDLITEDDKEQVLKLLKATFFQDEPLNRCVELGECKDLEIYCTKSISDGCSYKAVNGDGEIIGVFLNGIIKKPTADMTPCSLASSTDHPKFKKIMSLMDYVDSKFNIFALYPDIDLFVDGKILAVDSKYRGHGIAGHLTDKTIENLRLRKIPIFSILCSSHFSARVCEKMGFEEVFQLPFEDFVDDEGKPVLCPEKPHVSVRIFIRKILQ
ncbi:CLUMA_CG007349, isoform A [Clunio marinus]|uniref:aralkylamine N-acetyltransferase n=1 Tax=Clunio marinus TaxID=568069 RepID=A0A1J1I4L5_9DIPT|nr:CLUMA_CG007349, isoform A [Clunio marinus]